MTVDKYRFELIHEDRYEEACTFLTDHYCPDEPLSINFGILFGNDPVMKTETIIDLRQNMSLALISEETDKMIGIQILAVGRKGKINLDEYKESEKAKQLMSFIAYKDTIVDVFEYYDVEELFSIYELAVHRDHRRKGLGLKLMQAATILASNMDIGPCVIKGNAASNYSKRIFEKLDFENIGEVKFEDYIVDGVQVLSSIGDVNSFKMYGKILN